MSTNVMQLFFLAVALACVTASPDYDFSDSELSDEMKNVETNEKGQLPIKPLPSKPLFVSILFLTCNVVDSSVASLTI